MDGVLAPRTAAPIIVRQAPTVFKDQVCNERPTFLGVYWPWGAPGRTTTSRALESWNENVRELILLVTRSDWEGLSMRQENLVRMLAGVLALTVAATRAAAACQPQWLYSARPELRLLPFGRFGF